MPVNDRYPLPDVLAECHRYFALRRRKVFVEYVMLAGVNDSPAPGEGARGAARPEGLQGEPDPVQPDRVGQQGTCSTARRAPGSPRSRTVLDRARSPSTVRLTRGRDIAAACGQLAATALNTTSTTASSSRSAVKSLGSPASVLLVSSLSPVAGVDELIEATEAHFKTIDLTARRAQSAGSRRSTRTPMSMVTGGSGHSAEGAARRNS